MRRIILPAFLIVFTTILSFAKAPAPTVKCIVRVSMNDCLNCFGAIQGLANINEHIPILFVFPKNRKDEAKSFIQRYASFIKDYKIEVSDKKFNSLSNSPHSTVHLLNEKNVQLFSCELKYLDRHIDTLNNVLYEALSENMQLKVPHLPVNFEYRYSDHYIFLYNNDFHELYYYNRFKDDDRGQININDSIYHVWLEWFFTTTDTSVRRIHYQLLKEIGKPHTVLYDACGYYNAGDTLYVAYLFKYLKPIFFNGKNDQIWKKTYAIAKYIGNKMLDVKLMDKPPNETYSYYEWTPFFVHDNHFYFYIAKYKALSTAYPFVGEWIVDSSRYKFAGIKDFSLPDFYIQNKIFYHMSGFHGQWPYVIPELTNKIYNISTLAQDSLPIHVPESDFSRMLKGILKLNYEIQDFAYTGDTAAVIYRTRDSIHNVYRIAKIYLPTYKLIADKEIIPGAEYSYFAAPPVLEGLNHYIYVKKGSDCFRAARIQW